MKVSFVLGSMDAKGAVEQFKADLSAHMSRMEDALRMEAKGEMRRCASRVIAARLSTLDGLKTFLSWVDVVP